MVGGNFGNNHFAVTEVAAWICLANLEKFNPRRSKLFADDLAVTEQRIERDLAAISKAQLDQPAGAWSPVREQSPQLARTYSTIMAVWAIAKAKATPELQASIGDRYDQALDEGVSWLLETNRPSIGWIPSPNAPDTDQPMPGLTGQAILSCPRSNGCVHTSVASEKVPPQRKRSSPFRIRRSMSAARTRWARMRPIYARLLFAWKTVLFFGSRGCS
jgi:hypothetical protein